MRTVIFLFIATFAFINTNHAQVKFGVKAGLSTIDISPNEIAINNPDNNQNLGLSIAEAKYGFHAGIFTTIPLGKWFIQPEVLLNTAKVEYQLTDLSFSEVTNGFFSESYTSLDVPLLLGFKLGPLRLNGGPVGHIHINSQSELTDIDGYSQKFADMNYGWQAGLGLDIGKLRIDARYEGNFNKFGEHINFDDTAYNFDNSPGRFIASVGFAF